MSDTGKVQIHGKLYETVASRISKFRGMEMYRDFSIETEIIQRDSDWVVMKATIKNEQGRIMATGHSEEYREGSTINKTSALENSETSAIGRALAAFGLGGTEFASADEVAHAITKKGVHKPSDGAMERLDTDMQTHVRDLADEVKLKVVKGDVKGAYEWLQAANLDADAKVACWSLLQPAHIRTSLTNYANALKASGPTS